MCCHLVCEIFFYCFINPNVTQDKVKTKIGKFVKSFVHAYGADH